MKTRKWSALLVAAMTALCFGSCDEDWGQMDPPTANQTYPTLEKVASLTFDEEDGEALPYNAFAYEEGNVPDLVIDEEITGKKQNTLHLDSGYVQMFNPMYNTTVQEGVSMTFFIRQAGPTEEQVALSKGEKVPEGVLPYKQDVTSALFKWESEDGAHSLILDNNGGLIYDGADGTFNINLPANVQTGLLDDPAEWHYVALSIHSKGYFVYVDGKKRINETVSSFDMTKIGQFMANAPTLYIGYDGANINEEWNIDEITWYRNTITSAQTTDPRKPADTKDWSITVGLEDCTGGWWTHFSDHFVIEPNQTFQWGFENYGSLGGNWNNFNVVITNGKNLGEDGYKEYVVLRSDLYGWGDSYAQGTWDNNYNNTNDAAWVAWREKMNGSYVKLTITRDGGTVTMKAVATTKNNEELWESFTFPVDEDVNIGTFLVSDGSYLVIHPEDVWVGETFEPGSYMIGAADNTTPWWTAFSEYYPISGKTLTFDFINNNTGGGSNWNNWVAVCAKGAPGSEEYFALRADNYGWAGNADTGGYAAATMVSGYNWDTFVKDMCGARCIIQCKHSGTDVEIIAKQFTASGTAIPDYSFAYSGTAGSEGIFFVVDNSNIDMRVIGTFPYFENINK